MQGNERQPRGLRVRLGRPDDPASLAECDYAFRVTSEALGPFDGRGVTHRTIDVAPYTKTYGFDDQVLLGFLGSEDRRLFVIADEDDAPLGYAAASAAWNNFVGVDDLAVDATHRRTGAGRMLMDAIVAWARQRQAAGIRLETQTNNISACRFYERYGFVLGGFDRYLYAGGTEHRSEVALYWYLIFDQ